MLADIFYMSLAVSTVEFFFSQPKIIVIVCNGVSNCLSLHKNVQQATQNDCGGK